MFDLQIHNSKELPFSIQLGKMTWLILALYFIFCYGGFHPEEATINFLGNYCFSLIVIINLPAIWKIIVELFRQGHIELKIILFTLLQIGIPLFLLS